MNRSVLLSFVTKRSLFTLLILSLLTAFSLRAQGSVKSIYDYKVETIDGDVFDLATLKGKKVMVVNVASACGLTPQYEQLQAIYEQYKDKGFEIIAFPSNDFKEQESASNEEIKSFCTLNFGVSFPMMSKIKVKGQGKAPLYEWLTSKSLNGKEDSEVAWNFQKYLINPDGSIYKVISPKTRPDDPVIIEWITGK